MMLIHKLASTALAAGVLASITATSVLAAPPSGQPGPNGVSGYSLQCQEGACTLQADLAGVSPLGRLAAGVAVNGLNASERALPAGATVAIDDDLTVTLPTGKVTLPKADLALTLDDNHRVQRLHGTAQVPFPSFGLLGDALIVTPAMAEVGLDSGASLAHLNAPLKADRQYLFFTVGAGLDVAAASQRGPLRLAVPPGQRATLIIDTQEPLVYLAGNVTVSDPGQVALVGPLLDVAQRSELIPDALPLHERTQVTLAGQFSPAAGESFVEIGGARSVEIDAAGQWLNLDARPLAVSGWVRISGDGMLLNGVVGASLAPDTVFDGELGLEAWIPFSSELDGAYAQISGSAAVPLANLSADATARVTLPLDVQAQARVVTAGSERTVAWRPGAGEPTAATALQRTADSLSGWVGNALQTAGQGISSGGRWIARNAASGQAVIASWLPSAAQE